MSDAETTIFTILTGDADVKRIANTRVYPLVMPQDPTLPAITVQRVNSNPVNTLAGYSGLSNPHVMVNSWAMNYKEAKDLAQVVHTAMNGATMKNVLTNEMDAYEPEVNLFVVSQDFSIWNSE